MLVNTIITSSLLYGAPGAIRTPDRLVRSQVLYPAELRAHGGCVLSGLCNDESTIFSYFLAEYLVKTFPQNLWISM